ncbi:MAG: hypothetical protein DME91_08000 [Verrucomicrobia bacterium]|nr:MAG: hypothetical protein DME91_08000 [Verrucomicrobiota bacterium]
MKQEPEMPSSGEDQSQFVKDSALYKEFLAERQLERATQKGGAHRKVRLLIFPLTRHREVAKEA